MYWLFQLKIGTQPFFEHDFKSVSWKMWPSKNWVGVLPYCVRSLSALGFYVLKGLSCGILHFQNNSSLCNHLDKNIISLTPNKLPPSHCTRHQISSRNLDKFFKILSCLVHFQHSRLKKMHLRGELRCHHTLLLILFKRLFVNLAWWLMKVLKMQ